MTETFLAIILGIYLRYPPLEVPPEYRAPRAELPRARVVRMME